MVKYNPNSNTDDHISQLIKCVLLETSWIAESLYPPCDCVLTSISVFLKFLILFSLLKTQYKIFKPYIYTLAIW